MMAREARVEKTSEGSRGIREGEGLNCISNEFSLRLSKRFASVSGMGMRTFVKKMIKDCSKATDKSREISFLFRFNKEL